MKFEDILYRKTLKYELVDGFHHLLKYKDNELEVWVFYDDDHRCFSFDDPIQCSPCLPFFIRLNGSEEYEICEPYELFEEENGKIKYIGITKFEMTVLRFLCECSVSEIPVFIYPLDSNHQRVSTWLEKERFVKDLHTEKDWSLDISIASGGEGSHVVVEYQKKKHFMFPDCQTFTANSLQLYLPRDFWERVLEYGLLKEEHQIRDIQELIHLSKLDIENMGGKIL